jgi:hypothetical protein
MVADQQRGLSASQPRNFFFFFFPNAGLAAPSCFGLAA